MGAAEQNLNSTARSRRQTIPQENPSETLCFALSADAQGDQPVSGQSKYANGVNYACIHTACGVACCRFARQDTHETHTDPARSETYLQKKYKPKEQLRQDREEPQL